MGGFIAQQPNGRYCRCSTIVECPTHYNMTREDYLDGVTGNHTREERKDILQYHLQPFEAVVESTTILNMNRETIDRIFKEMTENPTGSYVVTGI
ncbi:hypothetical protein [Terribacillus sp. 7520-G]|uniref:hypothetical protein n=1 Tax=Terribacillus TaxID=459532 RepID=UPI000BA60D2B|nr:hypothetical protein [Terribacillus sp. 7520-G]PAD38631.1 hypothetical protein CHH53_10400 [Terribacillus sp. 7520-G]